MTQVKPKATQALREAGHKLRRDERRLRGLLNDVMADGTGMAAECTARCCRRTMCCSAVIECGGGGGVLRGRRAVLVPPPRARCCCRELLSWACVCVTRSLTAAATPLALALTAEPVDWVRRSGAAHSHSTSLNTRAVRSNTTERCNRSCGAYDARKRVAAASRVTAPRVRRAYRSHTPTADATSSTRLQAKLLRTCSLRAPRFLSSTVPSASSTSSWLAREINDRYVSLLYAYATSKL